MTATQEVSNTKPPTLAAQKIVTSLEHLSNRNLVYSFIEELQQLEEGAVPCELLTDSQRRSLRKWGILQLDHSYNGKGLKLTRYGRKLLQEAEQ